MMEYVKALARNLFRGKRWGHAWTPIGFHENGKFRNGAKYLDHERGGVTVRRRFTDSAFRVYQTDSRQGNDRPMRRHEELTDG